MALKDVAVAGRGPVVKRVGLPVQMVRVGKYGSLNGVMPKVRDVPYVPTPEHVVEEMLRVAEVKARDVVYDLGCGDGRMVIAAARERGARGVGVDIDPERIKECKANAAAAGVEDKVTFLQQSLFESEFSEATVLLTYLLPWVNARLRPRYLTELRPGTRILSHSFEIKDWDPDRTVHIHAGNRTVHLWVVPARVAGVWRVSMRAANGKMKSGGLRFEQQFQHVIGFGDVAGREVELEESAISGKTVSFVVPGVSGGAGVRWVCEVEGETMRGMGRAVDGVGHAMELRGRRVEGTAELVPVRKFE